MTADQLERDHHGELKVRQVGFIHADNEATIAVEHVYDNDICCPRCGTLSTGFVGIRIYNPKDQDDHGDERGDEHDGEKCASACLSAKGALLLADRITRAAHLALETLEEPADIEREIIRHSEGHEEDSRHD